MCTGLTQRAQPHTRARPHTHRPHACAQCQAWLSLAAHPTRPQAWTLTLGTEVTLGRSESPCGKPSDLPSWFLAASSLLQVLGIPFPLSRKHGFLLGSHLGTRPPCGFGWFSLTCVSSEMHPAARTSTEACEWHIRSVSSSSSLLSCSAAVRPGPRVCPQLPCAACGAESPALCLTFCV